MNMNKLKEWYLNTKTWNYIAWFNSSIALFYGLHLGLKGNFSSFIDFVIVMMIGAIAIACGMMIGTLKVINSFENDVINTVKKLSENPKNIVPQDKINV